MRKNGNQDNTFLKPMLESVAKKKKKNKTKTNLTLSEENVVDWASNDLDKTMVES
jgi:hypothetical protein